MAEKFLKFHPVKFGLACGIVSAIFVFITTIAGIYSWLGGFPLWNALILDIYGSLGFDISWLGALLGALFAFIDGFILAIIFAWIYNKIL
jgi:hypothetical protein